MADLWLHRMSTTDASLMKTVLKDGTWQGTWCSNMRRYQRRRKSCKDFAKLGQEGPGCPESGCTWCRFAFPPDDGVVDGLKYGCWLQVDAGIAQREAAIIGTNHFGGFESGLGVGAKVMDDVPELEPVLEAVRGQDVFDHFGSEAMAGQSVASPN